MPAAARSITSKNRAIAGISLLSLAAGILLLFLRPWNTRPQVELLRDYVIAPPEWGVRNGRLIEGKRVRDRFVVTSRGVRGGAEKILFSMDLSGRAIRRLSLTESEFRFFTDPETPTDLSRPGYIEGDNFSNVPEEENPSPPRPTPPARNYLAPEDPATLPAGAKRIPRADSITPRDIRTILHRVPLDGSPVQSTLFELTDVRGEPVWAKDTVFFFRAPRGGWSEVTLPDGRSFFEHVSDASLFARSLSGGDDRLLGANLPPLWRLYAFPDEQGISFRTVRPYPEPPYDLLRFPAQGAKPVRIPDFHGVQLPLLYQNRLWWLERESVLDAPQSQVQKLASCRPDGSDSQTIVLDTDAEDKPLTTRELALCDGKLYLLYTREDEVASRVQEANEKVNNTYLARLHPERPDLMSAPVLLPRRSTRFHPLRCDGGFYYFFTEEIRRDPLDFLKEETTDRKVHMFRRIRLPE